MSVARVIAGRSHEVISCSPTDSVQSVAQLLAEKRIGALPVMDGGQLVGIFSERDFLRILARDGAAALTKPVSEIMTATPITISPDQDALSALSLMTKRRIRHLPVVEDGKVLDFISIGDMVKFRIEQIETEAAQMRDYISMA